MVGTYSCTTMTGSGKNLSTKEEGEKRRGAAFENCRRRRNPFVMPNAQKNQLLNGVLEKGLNMVYSVNYRGFL